MPADSKRTQTSKLKTLYTYQILSKYSDEDNPLSTTDLIKMLAEKGINCERKAIYADIEALRKVGVDIVMNMSPKRGFFIASRQFEIPEVILLIDAVSSAGFITPKKSEALINKLKTLVSVGQAENIKPLFYVDTASEKCDNEEIYITIDRLSFAVNHKLKVKFRYRRRCVDKKNVKAYTVKTMTVSPYSLIWKEDHYYLICNNGKYDNLMNLRIDRIRHLEVLDEPYRPFEEVSEYSGTFDTQDYSSKMFNMFSGEVGEITLKCSLNLQEEMLDRFGKKIPLTAVDLDHFETTVKAAVSDGLASWIMQYGADIEVINPPKLREMVADKASKIAEIY